MQTVNKPQAFARRGSKWVMAAVAPMLFLSGCATQTQTGAAVGAGAGAVAGGLLGAMAHVPVAGAVVGAAAGTMVGATVGAEADAQNRQKAIAADVAARGGPLTLEQIRDMVHNNISDGVIMDQIRATRTVYQLTPEQITWLHNEGVSDPLIQYMMRPPYYGPRYAPGYAPVVYAPPPVGVVVVGGGYRRY